MQAVRALDAETLDQPVLDHCFSPAEAFLRGLKHECDRPGDFVAAVSDQRGGAEQNCDVAVVSAGMHRPVRLRAVRVIELLENRQRIHVGTQHDGPAGPRRPAGDPTTPVVPMPSWTS